MNYITAINSFWYSATMNPLSTGQIALWFALMHINNGCNWTEWFQAPNQVLSVLTGMSRSGILKARNELKQRGLPAISSWCVSSSRASKRKGKPRDDDTGL